MAARPRKRQAWIAAGALLVAAAVALAGWRLGGWSAERHARYAFAALSQCLLGAAQGELAGAAPHARLRGVELAVSLDPKHETWPARCARYLDALESSVGALRARGREACDGQCCAGDERCTLYDELGDEIGHASELLRHGRSDAFDVDRLYELARRLGLEGDPPSGVPAPPPPVALVDPARMTPLYRGNYLRLLTDPAGTQSLELLFYEHEARYGHCVLARLGDATARCRVLSQSIPVGLAGELLAAEPGAPPRMYAQGPEGDGWMHAIYDVDSGARIAAVSQRPAGAFVWRDGSIAHVGLEPPMADLSLYRTSDGEAATPWPLELSEAVSAGPRLVWDELVWTVPAGGGRHRIFARRVKRGEAPLGEVRELGETEPLLRDPTFDVCRSEQALVLVVGHHDAEGALGSIVFRTERGWLAPVAFRTPASRFGFTCEDEHATLSWIVGLDERPEEPAWGTDDPAEQPVIGSYRVHRLRCTPSGCREEKVTLVLHRFSRSSRYVAGDLGRAMAVLWRSAAGDVRMRVAPLAELPRAPEIPLFDDVEHDGFGWDLESDPIFGRAGSMVVLVSRQIETSEASAIYGFLVDATGTVTPLRVSSTDAL